MEGIPEGGLPCVATFRRHITGMWVTMAEVSCPIDGSSRSSPAGEGRVLVGVDDVAQLVDGDAEHPCKLDCFREKELVLTRKLVVKACATNSH